MTKTYPDHECGGPPCKNLWHARYGGPKDNYCPECGQSWKGMQVDKHISEAEEGDNED